MISKMGTLKTWGPRGFGKVSTRANGKIENYWLHVSDIEYSEPEEAFPGCSIVFETTGVASAEGKFPTCLKAKVYLPATPTPGSNAAVAALSGRSTVEPSAAEAGQSEGTK